jgi:hypothetical protein
MARFSTERLSQTDKWRERAISLKCPAQGQMSAMAILQQLELSGCCQLISVGGIFVFIHSATFRVLFHLSYLGFGLYSNLRVEGPET